MSKESLESKTDARITARRRLVRGVFAAPAALTLYSGSVAASSVSCVAQQQTTTYVGGTSGASDAWVRVVIYLLEPPNNNNASKQSFWVSGASLFALAAPAGVNFTSNSTSMTNTSWLLVKVGTGTDTSCEVRRSSSSSDPKIAVTVGQIIDFEPWDQGAQPSKTSQYLAVRINSTGQIVGVEKPSGTAAFGGTGSALITSCWNSFNPAAIL